MIHPRLAAFTDQMDAVVASTADPHDVAKSTARDLPGLLAHPEFLADEHRQPDPDHYRQHLVHVHPEGAYSIVALVWKPGQATPIHDHRCWCVVGVLQGGEAETRYRLFRHDDQDILVVTGMASYQPGDVCQLVPPDENIHRVANGGQGGLSISIHVYGTDIGVVGTSVNRVFDQPIRDEVPDGAQPVSWRSAA